MFTGIVTHTAQVLAVRSSAAGRELVLDPRSIAGPEPWSGLLTGESIAVNGCCLTLVGDGDRDLRFDVVPETLRLTNLGQIQAGKRVNLERSLRVGDRLGGHYVTGHIDATGRIDRWERGSQAVWLGVTIEDAPDFTVIHKGSVAVDGVSLTVAECDRGHFTVALIPHTLEVTRLKEAKVGDRVNLEMDHVGKWVRRLLAEEDPEGRAPGRAAKGPPPKDRNP